MSDLRHIAVQVRIYKKDDINLDTYHKHIKTQTYKPFTPKLSTKHIKPTKKLNKEAKKETVQQKNINLKHYSRTLMNCQDTYG